MGPAFQVCPNTNERNRFAAESQYLTWPGIDSAAMLSLARFREMVVKIEHRHSINAHPGAIVLRLVNQANMGSCKTSAVRSGNRYRPDTLPSA